MTERPGIILDRDGTLIDVVRDEETGTVHTAFHPSHIVFLPGVIRGLHALRDAGFALTIATNQPGAAKGQISRDAIERTNQALLERLAEHGVHIARLVTCLHHPVGGPHGDVDLIRECECRKPNPGLVRQLLELEKLDKNRSLLLGDSVSDVQAAHAAGVRAGLIFAMNRCELCPLRSGVTSSPDWYGPRFDLLVDRILSESH